MRDEAVMVDLGIQALAAGCALLEFSVIAVAIHHVGVGWTFAAWSFTSLVGFAWLMLQRRWLGYLERELRTERAAYDDYSEWASVNGDSVLADAELLVARAAAFLLIVPGLLSHLVAWLGLAFCVAWRHALRRGRFGANWWYHYAPDLLSRGKRAQRTGMSDAPLLEYAADRWRYPRHMVFACLEAGATIATVWRIGALPAVGVVTLLSVVGLVCRLSTRPLHATGVDQRLPRCLALARMLLVAPGVIMRACGALLCIACTGLRRAATQADA